RVDQRGLQGQHAEKQIAFRVHEGPPHVPNRGANGESDFIFSLTAALCHVENAESSIFLSRQRRLFGSLRTPLHLRLSTRRQSCVAFVWSAGDPVLRSSSCSW